MQNLDSWRKLTDQAVSELPLQHGRAELLEEIMRTVAPDRPLEQPQTDRRHSRWLVPLAAAAVVAGIAGSSVVVHQLRGDTVEDTSFAASLNLPDGQGIVLDAPGWTVDSLGSDGIRFRKGGADLEVTSYEADAYDSYVTDREHIVEPPAPGEPIEPGDEGASLVERLRQVRAR